MAVLGYYLKFERQIAAFCVSYNKENSTVSDRPVRVIVPTLYLERERERDLCSDQLPSHLVKGLEGKGLEG